MSTSPVDWIKFVLNPRDLLSGLPYLAIYLAVFGMVFAESGLLVGFFLPGDSLLFTAGFLASQPKFGLSIGVLALGAFVCAVAGDSVALYVSTAAPTFHVEAYRMGYYQGLGGRLVWTSPETPGFHQARPAITYGTNMVEAHWQPSLHVHIDGSWPPQLLTSSTWK